MKNSVKSLVTTVLHANDNVYSNETGFDIASNVIGWVIVKLIHEEPELDLVFFSEGWDEQQYIEGFENTKEELITYLENILDKDIKAINIDLSDSVDVAIRKSLKAHNASYTLCANEISKIVLDYLIGFFSFYKNSSNDDYDESYVAGKIKVSDNIIKTCRAYIYLKYIILRKTKNEH